MKVNILGDKYKIIKLSEREPEMIENNWGAYINYETKEIKILNGQEDALIHEMVHGYLYKVGLDRLNNENDVEIIAKIVQHLARYNNMLG